MNGKHFFHSYRTEVCGWIGCDQNWRLGPASFYDFVVVLVRQSALVPDFSSLLCRVLWCCDGHVRMWFSRPAVRCLLDIVGFAVFLSAPHLLEYQRCYVYFFGVLFLYSKKPANTRVWFIRPVTTDSLIKAAAWEEYTYCVFLCILNCLVLPPPHGSRNPLIL